jgi:hypothetical protein
MPYPPKRVSTHIDNAKAPILRLGLLRFYQFLLSLPDLYPVFRFFVKFVGWFHIKGVVPGINVGQW